MQRARLPAAFESEPEISRSELRAQRIFKALRLWHNALDREAERMVMRRLGLLLALFFGFLASCLAAQGGANENIFTISVAAPASPKDVQVRYFLTGDFGVYSSSTTARDVDNKIAIRSVDEAKFPRTLKAIVYAPGGQFVMISVDDLAASSRERIPVPETPDNPIPRQISHIRIGGKELAGRGPLRLPVGSAILQHLSRRRLAFFSVQDGRRGRWIIHH